MPSRTAQWSSDSGDLTRGQGLCSDDARLITGTDLGVDGGARAKNFAYAPAAAEDLVGPLPLIVPDETPAWEG